MGDHVEGDNVNVGKGVTVVIPARNEEVGIEVCIRSVLAAAEKLSTEVDVLVVDDASRDGTSSRAEAAGARVIRHDVQSGVVAAWETGVAASASPVLVFVDADCTVDEEAFVELSRAFSDVGVGVVSGCALPIMSGECDSRSGSRHVVVARSSRFSASLLNEIKSRVGDHDFVAIGRLMAMRREAWLVSNSALPNPDRVVASAARRGGWKVVWVPGAKVYYCPPLSFRELRSDWRRTRFALARSPQTFDSIPRFVLLSAALAALQSSPLDAVCWVACRARLVGETIGRRGSIMTHQPVTWS